GYDRSDHFVNARTTKLTDAAGTAAPVGGIPDDFDYTNRIWAQAGLSVIETATRPVVSPAAGTASFTFPLSHGIGQAGPPEEQNIMSANNGPIGTVEVYYTGGLVSGALAETFHPSIPPAREAFTDVGPDGMPGTGDPGEGDGMFNAGEPFTDRGFDKTAGTGDFGEGDGVFNMAPDGEAIFMANLGVNARHNTLGHELGHLLLDDNNAGNGRSNAVHSPNAGAPGHSSDPRNNVGDPQWDPGTRAGQGGAPWDINTSLDVIGMEMSTNPNGSPKVGGVAKIEVAQIQAVFGETDTRPYLHIPNDNGLTYADRGDFDWVEDNRKLEAAGGLADNHPGSDFLLWEINPPGVGMSAHTDHQHDGWGELALGAFALPTFRTVDIISQIGRYIDSDIDGFGDRSRRESALDFRGFADANLFPEFSIDGLTWLVGDLVNVFELGWTKISRAEDFVSRWLSPIDATLIRLRAFDMGFGHDQNVQIDAVIASNTIVGRIPEPPPLLLACIALLAYRVCSRRARLSAPRP
ncbi:MAG: hypothetical protein ACREXT_17490, partial [Gammaproteobacteria bacterium]